MSSNSNINIGVTATDQARSVLQSVDAKVAGTANAVDSAGSKMITKSQQISQTFKQNFGSIAQSVAGLAAGITSFATSFSTLDKAQSRADLANLQLEKSQQRLNAAMAKGNVSAEKMALLQEEVRVNTEKAKIAQGELSDTYTNFLAQVPSQMISFGVAGSGILKMLGVSHGQAAVGANVQTGAMARLSASMHAFRAASILAFITNPVGIAIIAVTTLIAALAFNVGGLRDRMFELGGAILEFLDKHFKPLADAIRWFIDNVVKPFGDFFATETPANVAIANESITDFSQLIDEAKFTVQDFSTKSGADIETFTTKVSKSTANLNERYAAFLQQQAFRTSEFGKVWLATWQNNTSAVKQAVDNISADLDKLQQKQTSTLGSISLDRVIAAGFGGNAAIAESAAAGRLGGVFVAGKGRVLDKGGTLFENVIGFGAETGTPHLLHKGETVSPGGNAGGGGVTHVHIYLGSKEIAHEIVGDITRLQNANARRTRGITR